MAMMTTVEKLLARAAALEQEAAGLRLAASYLSEEPLTKKRAAIRQTLKQAAALRHAQTNGGPPTEEAPAKVSAWAARLQRRDTKRETLLEILREYGKPMPVAELAEAARKEGITSLTGISGSVRAGTLKVTRRQGKTFYSAGVRPT